MNYSFDCEEGFIKQEKKILQRNVDALTINNVFFFSQIVFTRRLPRYIEGLYIYFFTILMCNMVAQNRIDWRDWERHSPNNAMMKAYINSDTKH